MWYTYLKTRRLNDLKKNLVYCLQKRELIKMATIDELKKSNFKDWFEVGKR